MEPWWYSLVLFGTFGSSWHINCYITTHLLSHGYCCKTVWIPAWFYLWSPPLRHPVGEIIRNGNFMGTCALLREVSESKSCLARRFIPGIKILHFILGIKILVHYSTEFWENEPRPRYKVFTSESHVFGTTRLWFQKPLSIEEKWRLHVQCMWVCADICCCISFCSINIVSFSIVQLCWSTEAYQQSTSIQRFYEKRMGMINSLFICCICFYFVSLFCCIFACVAQQV